MARSNPPKPCKSTGSELLVFLSENSYYSLTKGGWKASGYAHPIEYNGTNERDSRPRAKFDQDITFNSTSIYSSSSSRLDVSGVVYSCWHGSQAGGGCSRGREPDGTQLGFGRYGTQSCRAGRLSYRAIEAVRRATIGQFHRAMSGQFRRNGKIWVRVLADLPITGKPTEVRMGRGKGNPTGIIHKI
ncbi:60S ribosomal protein L16, mitochondrial [Vitis vinifera]|uniref:Large ribosomal subunit protein uL16m n=1 Tax=Vitis vinifera TaxID=29760 RepID=A0A438E143_VITVI|nr:60S ribosomal protein L16, mitochondrial [Vitis vinifera]